MTKISVVVPAHNEASGIADFYTQLTSSLASLAKSQHLTHEIVFCDDGSTDDTHVILRELAAHDKQVTVVSLSRNFGKEAALAAGIAQANGDAVITIDSDGQHPVELLPDFIRAWQQGAKVVVGIRRTSASDSLPKRLGSRAFYAIFNSLSQQKLMAGSTDYRLLDAAVAKAFLQLHESNRITRGLVDWLGFERSYVHFDAKPRTTGTAQYSSSKLFKLASDSIVSLSAVPLYISAGLGLLITPVSLIVGLGVFIQQIVLGDPLHWNVTGTAMLGIMLLFLVGIILIGLGILSVYISHIHTQSQQRPLYIINEERSVGIDHPKTS